MTKTSTHRIVDPSAWRGVDLERDRGWEFAIDDDERDELIAALNDVNREGLSLPEINAANFVLPRLTRKLDQISAHLKHGQGFALLRNFPVEGFNDNEREVMYWGLCTHLGHGVTQNSDLGFIHYVTDGKRRPNQGTRGVGSPKETILHVDLTDIASLLCVRQAPDDPHSRVASSTFVYNEVAAHRPEQLSRLIDGFEWDRMGEHTGDETPTSGYRVPFFSVANGQVSCQYNRVWMESANERHGEPMSASDRELLDFVDEIALANCFEFPFHTGDIQFCNNYTVMHGRAAHDYVDNEADKRVLMRIWLNAPGFRDFSDEAIVRYGIGWHGSLGWSAHDILAGRHLSPRVRRADGALDITTVNE